MQICCSIFTVVCKYVVAIRASAYCAVSATSCRRSGFQLGGRDARGVLNLFWGGREQIFYVQCCTTFAFSRFRLGSLGYSGLLQRVAVQKSLQTTVVLTHVGIANRELSIELMTQVSQNTASPLMHVITSDYAADGTMVRRKLLNWIRTSTSPTTGL